jgi:NADH-quinone oxidoreductase subunit H
MAFGWKRLIPVSLVWIVAVAAIRAASLEGGIDRRYLLIGLGVLAVLFLVLFFVGGSEEDEQQEQEAAAPEPVRAPGGFPVPPMPAGGAVRGAARPLTFESRAPRTEPTAATRNAGEEHR